MMKYTKAVELAKDAESLKGATVTVVVPKLSGERKDEEYEYTGSQMFCMGRAKERGDSMPKEQMDCRVNAILQKTEGKWKEVDKFPLQMVIYAINNDEKLYFDYFDQKNR